jgi:hypothetical protein
LDALKIQVENAGDGFDEQGFGQAWCAGDQAMTAGGRAVVWRTTSTSSSSDR